MVLEQVKAASTLERLAGWELAKNVIIKPELGVPGEALEKATKGSRSNVAVA
jgi:hypothetical protein